MLKIRHLVKSFGNQLALNQVCFEVAPGERVAILGASGSGKTTLLKSICRLIICDSGHISIKNKSIRCGFDDLHSVGIVLEDEGNMNLRMSVSQNVMYLGQLRGTSKTECARIAERLKLQNGLDNSADCEVGKLSTEEKKRAALICAIAHNPDILMLDMPDLSLVKAAITELEDTDNAAGLAGSAKRCLIVTSDNPVKMQYVCPRAIVLSEGSIVFDGSIVVLLENMYHYELRLSMPLKLLLHLEAQLMKPWKSEKMYWKIDQDILILNYRKTHDVFPTLQWIQQHTEESTHMTIESISLENCFRRLEH